MAPEDQAPPPNQTEPQAAAGRPFGVGSTLFATNALRLLENGYQPLPIRPGTKQPILKRWSQVAIDAAAVERWSEQHPGCGIGLRTGRLVGVDIDLLDPDLAHNVGALLQARLGLALMLVGRWPKRLLLYRTEVPFPKMSLPGVEVLGLGQQFVAFGIHPSTHQPYYWPQGETPLDVPLAELPEVDAARWEDMLAEMAALLPPPPRAARGQASRNAPGTGGKGPVRDADGRVVDGRDTWLSSIAYHATLDAAARDQPLDPQAVAAQVWERFTTSTDLTRPRKDGTATYASGDAARKVADKLRLLAEGRLPPRDALAVEAAYEVPGLSAAAARAQLDEALREACAAIEAWHAETMTAACPQIGIRATVGLGKSAGARRHLLALRARLLARGAPARILVFTPSHALAEETAAAWRTSGVQVAVHRGYEAQDLASGQPMCRDLPAVRAAVLAGVDVHSAACIGTGGRSCRLIQTCAKQRNRAAVAAADVVVAAYDALYSGFAIDPASIGALLIDEGCWARAVAETRGLWVETFAQELTGIMMSWTTDARDAGAMADLMALRSRAAQAFGANGAGPVLRSHLVDAGLTERDCRDAVQIEARRLRDPCLYPGMSRAERSLAMRIAAINARTQLFIATWKAMAGLLAGGQTHNGRLEIRSPDAGTGLHEIVATDVRAIHQNLRDKPVLHLDATLRTALARTILPELSMRVIEAAAPQMSVRLITGRFGKGAICPDPRGSAEETMRRLRRLRDCVDHVRWQAARVAPGCVLVVTYKDCEAAFAGIPNVVTAHFNAISGLDIYRDVRLLMTIGRPLPSTKALGPLCGAFFAHGATGGYRHVVRGVRMRDGTSRSIRALEHEDVQAEILRAAICDDELIQAIGRGRGVNRTAATPLEVQVLADVALPLVHDRVLAWEQVVPDIVQRMLLAGVTTDSPADAAALHPDLFASAEQAEKAFPRAGFNRQTPIGNSYREMSVKSAAYRHPGRGRSWQRAYWIDGDGSTALAALARTVGPIAEWVPMPG